MSSYNTNFGFRFGIILYVLAESICDIHLYRVELRHALPVQPLNRVVQIEEYHSLHEQAFELWFENSGVVQ